MRTRIMCAEFVQEDWVCVTSIKDLFMMNARAWKINPANLCYKNMSSSHQNDLFRIGSIFKYGQTFWALYPMCQWSGEDFLYRI